MFKLLTAVPLPWKILGIATIVLGLLATAYIKGGDVARAAAAIAADRERQRQEQANDFAQQEIADTIALLEQARRERDSALLNLAVAAANDPDAGVCTLPLGSVLRHNDFIRNAQPGPSPR